MGSPGAAEKLLHGWIRAHSSSFTPELSKCWEASIASQSSSVVLTEGFASFVITVAAPLSNNYGTLNGGSQAALAAIAAEAALRTLSNVPVQSIVSCSSDYLSAGQPGDRIIVEARLTPGVRLLQ